MLEVVEVVEVCHRKVEVTDDVFTVQADPDTDEVYAQFSLLPLPEVCFLLADQSVHHSLHV